MQDCLINRSFGLLLVSVDSRLHSRPELIVGLGPRTRLNLTKAAIKISKSLRRELPGPLSPTAPKPHNPQTLNPKPLNLSGPEALKKPGKFCKPFCGKSEVLGDDSYAGQPWGLRGGLGAFQMLGFSSLV